MSNQSLTSLNNQQLNGNVRRLSQKFEKVFHIKTRSNEQLSSPKSQLFTSIHKSFIDGQSTAKTRILTTRSNTIPIYNTNANEDVSNDSLNENSTSVIDSLLNLLSNKELRRIIKQIIVGGSVGALSGSLLGQTNLTAKLAGLLTTTLFTGEHIANFTQWTSFNLGKLEYSNPKIPYSNTSGILKNIDSFFSDNMPTIISFLFASVLSSSINFNSYNNIPTFICQSSPLIEQENVLPVQINPNNSCLCPCHYHLSTQIQFIPVLPSTNKDYHSCSSY